jgi:hypothetical protein
VGADEQLAADAGVVPAAPEQGQHLALARGEPVQRRVGVALTQVEQAPEQLREHPPRDDPLACQGGLDRAEHRAGAALLAHHPDRP